MEGLAAGENIHGGVCVLGPCMDGEVGFRNDHDAADAEGAELVEMDADDGGFGDLGRRDHGLFHSLYITEELGVATVQLKHQMPAECVQFIPPPSLLLY